MWRRREVVDARRLAVIRSVIRIPHSRIALTRFDFALIVPIQSANVVPESYRSRVL